MKEKIIEYVKEKTGIKFEDELESAIFHSERIMRILEGSKNLKRDDKNILIDLLNLISNL